MSDHRCLDPEWSDVEERTEITRIADDYRSDARRQIEHAVLIQRCLKCNYARAINPVYEVQEEPCSK